MVHTILEYSSYVCDPHTSLTSKKLESVPRHAARFCLGEYSRYSSVTSMLLLLGLPGLQPRRKLANLITSYSYV